MSFTAWLRRVTRRLDEDDFEAEIRAHLSMAEQDRIADGADRDEAHYAALREFGNVTLTTEAARGVWRPGWLDRARDWANDVRYARRTLAKDPLFSLTVIGVLALGIGLNASVFTLLKSLALRPLSGVEHGSRLHVVYAEMSTGRDEAISYPDYKFLRDHDRAFSALFGSRLVTANLGRGRGARQVSAQLVTGNYFQVLGVGPEIGRLIGPGDEIAPGRHPIVVLSDALWRRDFGGDPQILGRTVEINNYPLTVVGIADPAFHGTIVSYDVEVFIPIMMGGQILTDFGSARINPSNFLTDRLSGVLYPHGYLREGTTLASAAAQTDALWKVLASDRPESDTTVRLRVVPFSQVPGSAQANVLPAVGVMTVMGLLVLLIACANIAGLVLVRGISRRGEIAIRLALGGTRSRIVRLLLVENLLLAVPGAAVGVLLASYFIPALVAIIEPMAAPQRLYFNIELDRYVLAFAVLVGCASAFALGFAPALQSSRVDLVSVINEDASPRGAARGRLRAALVIVQVAVSLLLLVGASLTMRSVEAAGHVYPGFDASHTTAVAMNLTQNRYDEARGRIFYRRLLDGARTDPGIESASLAAYTPLAFLETRSLGVAIEGYVPRRGEDLSFMSNTITSGYFETLRIPVVAGRAIDDGDDEAAAPVAMVNTTMAQRFWGSAAQAVGKRMRVADGQWRTVIGVAADVKYLRVDEAPTSYFYVPLFQYYRPGMTLHTRGTGPVDDLVAQARATVAATDPDLPILFARPLEREKNGALFLFRFTALMLLIFGMAGMALAAMGTYGLVSYIVKQSAHEIGIRIALGASGRSIVRRFVARGLRLAAIGAAIGIVAAFGLGRLLGGVLFGVSPTDGVSFARALAVVLGVVVLATIVPAWRASRTNPIAALRHQ
jgi:predicted permease